MSSQVVLIAGGPTGIGRAAAVAFAKKGAKVVVAGRRDEAGKALVIINISWFRWLASASLRSRPMRSSSSPRTKRHILPAISSTSTAGTALIDQGFGLRLQEQLAVP
jgi:short chain dehydrogenase